MAAEAESSGGHSSSNHGASFEHVNLKGRNVGAAMSLRHADTAEPNRSFCINIYVNNNVQGVNNSFLLGSEVKMRDSGVSIFLEDFNLEKRKKKRSKNKTRNEDSVASGSKMGFFPVLLLTIFALFLFLHVPQ